MNGILMPFKAKTIECAPWFNSVVDQADVKKYAPPCPILIPLESEVNVATPVVTPVINDTLSPSAKLCPSA